MKPSRCYHLPPQLDGPLLRSRSRARDEHRISPDLQSNPDTRIHCAQYRWNPRDRAGLQILRFYHGILLAAAPLRGTNPCSLHHASLLTTPGAGRGLIRNLQPGGASRFPAISRKCIGGNEKAELSISRRGDARSSLSHPDGEMARRAWLKNGFDRGKLGVGCQDGRGERGARHTVGDRFGYWGGTMVSFMMTWLGVGMGYVFYEACWEYGWLGLVWGWNFGTCRDMFFLLGVSSAVD